MPEPGELYLKATLNIGAPPSAEAYCRALAMEVERLATNAERSAWDRQIRDSADELWAEAKKFEQDDSAREKVELLKTISSNLHRLCQIMKGGPVLPAPGSRLE